MLGNVALDAPGGDGPTPTMYRGSVRLAAAATLLSGALAFAVPALAGVGTTGSAAEPPLQLIPTPVEFEPIAAGTFDTTDVMLHNDGTQGAADITGIHVLGAGYELLVNECPTTLEANESCDLTIQFGPPDPATNYPGTLTVDFVTEGAPLQTITAAITGQSTSVTTTTTAVTSTTPPSPGSTPPPQTDPPLTSPETSPPESPPPPTSVPSTDPPTTDPSTDAELAERLRQCESQAKEAEVSFPDRIEMLVGRVTEVHVEVTLPGASAGETIPDTGPATTVVTANLTCFVKATLSGSEFDIEDPTQSGSLLDTQRIDWFWDVTPQSAGDHQLALRITPRVELPGGRVENGTPRGPFTANIDVNAEERNLWERFSDWLTSVVEHPLVRGVGPFIAIAGLIAAFWKWVLRRPWPWAKDKLNTTTDEPDDSHDGYL
jgi:hypothetical protein